MGPLADEEENADKKPLLSGSEHVRAAETMELPNQAQPSTTDFLSQKLNVKGREIKDIFSNVKATMFAPDDWRADELLKCVRLMPHDNDTGGFFFTVFNKIPKETCLKDSNYDKKYFDKIEKQNDEEQKQSKSKGKNKQSSMLTVLPQNKDDESYNKLIEFFKINDS